MAAIGASVASNPRNDDEKPALASYGCRPKVLIATTLHWAATTRLALALAKHGFDVAAAAPADHALHRLSAIDTSFVLNSRWGARRSIGTAITAWRPDLVVPGDEDALRHLHGLHDAAAQGRGSDPRGMGELIRASLGDPMSFAIARKKSDFTEFARSEGLDMPNTAAIKDTDALRLRLRRATYPQVLKIDGGFGGLGVRIARNAEEAERAFAELETMHAWRSTVKRMAKYLSVEPLRDRLGIGEPVITLQNYVDGRPANRAVLCWQGEVLAGLSVEALQTHNDTGPATVVRAVDCRGMEAMAAHLVRRLRLSGFVGFDFILEASTGRCFLLEMNARPTQTCHLSLSQESDMVGALLAKLSGRARAAAGRRQGCEVIAFFPQEIWRNRESEHLRTAFHDVPWDEPQFIEAYAEPVPVMPATWVDRLRGEGRRLMSWLDGESGGAALQRADGPGAISKTPGW